MKTALFLLFPSHHLTLITGFVLFPWDSNHSSTVAEMWAEPLALITNEFLSREAPENQQQRREVQDFMKKAIENTNAWRFGNPYQLPYYERAFKK
jgi:hypothetical protein